MEGFFFSFFFPASVLFPHLYPGATGFGVLLPAVEGFCFLKGRPDSALCFVVGSFLWCLALPPVLWAPGGGETYYVEEPVRMQMFLMLVTLAIHWLFAINLLIKITFLFPAYMEDLSSSRGLPQGNLCPCSISLEAPVSLCFSLFAVLQPWFSCVFKKMMILYFFSFFQ